MANHTSDTELSKLKEETTGLYVEDSTPLEENPAIE